MTNFRPFETGRVCRRRFKFKEICRKFSKWLENTVGKGEIARYEQFLLFPQYFQKTCTADTIGQTFCFVNWVHNKGFLSMLCIAPGGFIRKNTVTLYIFIIRQVVFHDLSCKTFIIIDVGEWRNLQEFLMSLYSFIF